MKEQQLAAVELRASDKVKMFKSFSLSHGIHGGTC